MVMLFRDQLPLQSSIVATVPSSRLHVHQRQLGIIFPSILEDKHHLPVLPFTSGNSWHSPISWIQIFFCHSRSSDTMTTGSTFSLTPNPLSSFKVTSALIHGLPRWLSDKESSCQCRRPRRCRLDPWVGKIPWRRKWQPTPAFLPGKSH